MPAGLCCCGDNSSPTTSYPSICGFPYALPTTVTISESTPHVDWATCPGKANYCPDLYGTYNLSHNCNGVLTNSAFLWSDPVAVPGHSWSCGIFSGSSLDTRKQATVAIDCLSAAAAACPHHMKITVTILLVSPNLSAVASCTDSPLTKCSNISCVGNGVDGPSATCCLSFVFCASSIIPFFGQSSETSIHYGVPSPPNGGFYYYTCTIS